MAADIRPIAEIQQRTGVPIECGAFIGSSPIRQFAEGWTLDFLQKTTEDAIAFAVKEGITVMYVTEDTTRADPESLRRLFTTAIRAGARRLCVADTVGHATPNGAKAVVRFVKSLVDGVDVGIDWHGHRDRGLARSSIAALEAGATRSRRPSASASAAHLDRSAHGQPGDGDIATTISTPGPAQVADAATCGIAPNYPVIGADAFDRDRRPRRRRRQGVPEGRPRADGRRPRGGAGEPGRPAAGDRGRPDVGKSNVIFGSSRGLAATEEIVDRLRGGQASNRR